MKVNILVCVKQVPDVDQMRMDPETGNLVRAGVPAILGPEAGYRELRRDPLDYLEAGDPDAAMQALARLLDEPGLYPAMVANGTARGADFTVEATLQRWQRLLAQLAVLCADPARRPQSRFARGRREAWFRLRRPWKPYG